MQSKTQTAKPEYLLMALRHTIKEEGITYSTLAKQLGVPLSSLKRHLHNTSIPLEKLLTYCFGAGINLSELHQSALKLQFKNENFFNEIQDDVLFDAHANPLEKYWDDDCLEIFIDEDHSGGNHQFNFNAFAYHIALDNQAVDIGFEDAPNGPFLLLNQHINSQWKRQSTPPYKVIWEVAIAVHNDRFVPNSKMRTRVPLNEGKTLGFMLAYCDNDGSETREHFMGSHKITPVNGDKNLGYITADVFGDIKLIKSKK